MPDVGVRFEGVSIAYGGVEVVHEVDLEIQPGEAVALLGANGAGKSSVVKALIGAVRPSAGAVWVGEQRADGQSAAAITRLGVACVPEGRRVFATQSLADNLRVGAWPKRWGRRQLEAKVDAMFEQFPLLAERRRALAGSLSGGQAQMLSIAMALMSEPSVLILDEPSLGLAPVMIDTVMDEVARLRDGGTTILVVDENSECALAATSRAYVLRGGRVVLHRDTASLTDPAELHEAYLGNLVL
jgi:ABC-type branched-subunit amino acid transport system ATPase component